MLDIFLWIPSFGLKNSPVRVTDKENESQRYWCSFCFVSGLGPVVGSTEAHGPRSGNKNENKKVHSRLHGLAFAVWTL